MCKGDEVARGVVYRGNMVCVEAWVGMNRKEGFAKVK